MHTLTHMRAHTHAHRFATNQYQILIELSNAVRESEPMVFYY